MEHFKLRKTSFLDSFASDRFYVVLDFQNPNTGDKLQEVFFFEASDGKPRMEWSYSVLNSLAKLKVNEGTFVDDENAQIQQKGREFELPIALTPVEWNVQGETIERLGREGVEMLVSLKEHPDLKALGTATVTNAGCLAEFQSMDDALDFAKILGIKLRK